jgi:hypothetical protein
MKKAFVSFINFLGKLIRNNNSNDIATLDRTVNVYENTKFDETMEAHENTKPETDIKSIWTEIYKNWFDKKVDFSNLIIPGIYDPEKHFAIIVAEGITMSEIVQAMRKRFDVSLHDNLEYRYTKDKRIADKNYIVIFKKDIKTDFDNVPYRHYTVVDSDSELNGMHLSNGTLLERLLLEIFYYDTTSDHPDINVVCNGSWCGVRWIHVHWNNPALYAFLKTSGGMDGDCWH